jgi:penicillin G amidase
LKAWRTLGRAARRRIVFGIVAFGSLAVLAAIGLRDLQTAQREQSALPDVEGRVGLAGLQAEVTVSRDGHGVPHVAARSERDAWFALGYVHAQDRLAQMLWLRQVARGRSAEHVGRAGLPGDRLARSLDFAGVAKAQLAQLPQRARRVLESYAEGASARIERVRDNLEHAPVDVLRLGLPLDAWEPSDSLALYTLHAWNRDTTVDASLVLSDLNQHLDPATAMLFFPGAGIADESAPPDAQAKQPPQRGPWTLADSLRRASGWSGRGLGSSAWVLGAGHTQSGHPILAGDLHLDPTVPAAVHLDHIRGGGMEIAGATLPGVPVFWSGHNRKLAWFAVAAPAVVVDLYDEVLDPKDPTRYHDGSGWRPLDRREETLAVRGGRAQAFEVRRTRNGPLLPDLATPISVRWSGDRLDGRSGLAALIDAGYANDAHALLEALRDHREPIIAVAYADIQGAAGVKVAGYVPRRSLSAQLVPLPGRARHYQWRERVPYESLPSMRLDDPQGWVVAADAPMDVRGGEAIDWLWRSGARAARIDRLLGEATRRGPASLREVADLQADVGEDRALRIAQITIGLTRGSDLGPQAAEVVRLLESWDGQARADSAGAAVYHELLAELIEALLEPRVGKDLLSRYLALPQTDPEQLALDLLESAGSTGEASQRAELAEMVERCMRSAWLDLSYRLGANARRWAWGTLHPLHFRPLGSFAASASGGIGPFAMGGSSVTVSAASYDFASPFEATTASALRLVVDLGTPGQALALIAPGQTEHPGEVHRDDGIPRWLEGRAWLFATDPLLVEEGSVARLTLEPVR